MELRHNTAKSADGLGDRARSVVEQLAVRDTYRGFGDTMARAFELVLVPFIFGFAGWTADRWLGTGRVLMLSLGMLAVVGLAVRSWYTYDAAMRAHEAELPLAPRAQDV